MDTTQELPAGGAAALVLGRYRLGERLGAGGFGTVYAATDERLRRPVAVKVIPAGGRAGRGEREALAAARLDHPGVVAVLDAGQDGRARYLVSELVHGRTLDELSAEGRLSDRDVLRVGLALAGALEHAHARGVIHRDVKPQNVIVPDAPRSAAGVAKLADFGVAHLAGDEPLTRTGDVVGTLAYMAPEQAAGRRVDERADLYSLALVLYEALAGANPVRAGSPAATARRVGSVLPSLGRARRDLPEGLVWAVDAALRPRPEERGTLAELAEALADALPEVSDEGGTVAPHPLERTAPLGVPRWASRVGAGALAGGLAAGALAAVAATAGGGSAATQGVPGGGHGLDGVTAHGPAVAAHGADGLAAAVAWPVPALAGLAVAVAVALMPRAAWLVGAAGAVALLAGELPGAAVLVAAAVAPVPVLLRRHGIAWSVPAVAPALGLAGLAGAFPSLAGQARRWTARAALGALGAWWALLAELALGRALLGTDAPPPLGAGPAGPAADRGLGPLLTGGALLYALLWAAAALVLPWLVRGRWLAADVVAASAWAAALGAGTAAVAESTAAPEPRGLVAGALLAGALAPLLARARGGRGLDGQSASG